MSIRVMSWAWSVQLTNSTDKLVLLALADHSSDDGYCWPGQKGIAEKCCLTRSTVSKSCKRLVEAGLLKIEERKRDDGTRCANGYYLLMEGVKQDHTHVSETHTPCVGNAHPPVSETHSKNRQIEPSRETTPISPKGEAGMAEVREVFAYWQFVLNHPNTKLDDDRTKRIRKVLKVFTVEELKLAIVGITHSAWHMGRDPQNTKVYDSISVVFKNAENIERFIELGRKHQQPNTTAGNTGSRTRKTL